MCGRFSLALPLKVLSERFEVPIGTFDWHLRYNIAPTQPCMTIIEENHQRQMASMVWGLIPHWAKERKSGSPMINARAETITSKPSFRESFHRRRCLVPADGFFEWKKSPASKTPYRITLMDGGPFAFAGLWDIWKDQTGASIQSFTILTTEANSLVASLHDRMPVILKKEDESTWLDVGIQDDAKLESLLQPFQAEQLSLFEVSPIVNSWKNDIPECLLPLR